MTIAYTFSVLNTSVSVASSYTWVGGNRSSKISNVEKHHPRASQTLVFMKEYQSGMHLAWEIQLTDWSTENNLSKYFLVLKGVLPFRSLFFRSQNITQPCPQVFSNNGSIMCSGLHFWRHWFNMAKILCKFGEQQLVMVDSACGFNQSETGKYFE